MDAAPAKMAYTLPEAQAILPFGKTRLHQLIASGALPSRHRHGRRYILHGDLAALYERATAPAPIPTPKPEPLPRARGIYALFLQGQLVYIGRSGDIRHRVGEHRTAGREFDAARAVVCETEHMNWLEVALINLLQPPGNRLISSLEGLMEDLT